MIKYDIANYVKSYVYSIDCYSQINDFFNCLVTLIIDMDLSDIKKYPEIIKNTGTPILISGCSIVASNAIPGRCMNTIRKEHIAFSI